MRVIRKVKDEGCLVSCLLSVTGRKLGRGEEAVNSPFFNWYFNWYKCNNPQSTLLVSIKLDRTINHLTLIFQLLMRVQEGV